MTALNQPHPLLDRSLGDLVAERSRTAVVFERFGLDYCCHGHQTLREAARVRGVPVQDVLQALATIPETPGGDGLSLASVDLDVLTRHIVVRHHHYIRSAVPVLRAWLDKLVDRHGRAHPELSDVRIALFRLADELLLHMAKEENILFPYIDDMAEALRAGGRLPPGPFGTVRNPVRVMEDDHSLAGELADRLRTLTGGFMPPPDACRTYQLCYDELERFTTDLHRHVHLENHILFPRAIQLEHQLSE